VIPEVFANAAVVTQTVGHHMVERFLNDELDEHDLKGTFVA
jgi:hypothetical protein